MDQQRSHHDDANGEQRRRESFPFNRGVSNGIDGDAEGHVDGIAGRAHYVAPLFIHLRRASTSEHPEQPG